MHTYMHTDMHTYTHIYIHTYIHTHLPPKTENKTQRIDLVDRIERIHTYIHTDMHTDHADRSYIQIIHTNHAYIHMRSMRSMRGGYL